MHRFIWPTVTRAILKSVTQR